VGVKPGTYWVGREGIGLLATDRLGSSGEDIKHSLPQLMERYTRWLACILLSGALLGAVYLAWNSAGGGDIPGCGKGSACNSVLSSQWSQV